MPQHHIPCPKCQGAIKVTKSGPLLTDDRTGMLVRDCLVSCSACGRRGKALLTIDVAMYLDDEGLFIDPAPLPAIL